ncbi:MAG: hypothetical protein IJF76_03590 [Clostridia bacterium]|nr:hypothetical protein [Clostridia bacterium]
MESIHKIPINEAFSENCGCPICRLYERYDQNAIRFLFEEGVMNPETRIETNKYGFCAKHADALLKVGQSLSVALMLETRLQKLQGLLHEKQSLKGAIKEIEEAEHNCYICNRLDKSMSEIAEFISVMYDTEEGFKDKFLNQEYFCLPHAKLLLENCKLKGGKQKEYLQDILKKNLAFTMRTRRSLKNYAESFDYKAKRGAGEVDKNASQYAIDYLTGKR